MYPFGGYPIGGQFSMYDTEPRFFCVYCGEEMYEDEAHFNDDGDPVCDWCWSNLEEEEDEEEDEDDYL